MKKKIVTILGYCLIPVGAVLLSACAPADMDQTEANLDTVSDNYSSIGYGYGGFGYGGLYGLSYYDLPRIPTEYGRCENAIDDDGDGDIDGADWRDCAVRPVVDLSIAPAPIGHNFAPIVPGVVETSPGLAGGFRDPAMTTRWNRFKTDMGGVASGHQYIGPGVPPYNPVPAPTSAKILQGTFHPGNNNNSFPWNVIIPQVGSVRGPEFRDAASTPVLPALLDTYADPYVGPGDYYKTGSQGLSGGW
jgi:hypothetical protein